MDEKYIVRLKDAEREQLHQIIKKFNAFSQKLRRAQILLKPDAHQPLANVLNGVRPTSKCFSNPGVHPCRTICWFRTDTRRKTAG